MSKQKQPVMSKQVLYKTKQANWPKAAHSDARLNEIENRIERKDGKLYLADRRRFRREFKKHFQNSEEK